MASRQYTSCIGIARMVVWSVACIANLTALSTPVHSPFSKSSHDVMVWLLIMFLIVWWLRSTIELACGLCVVISLMRAP
jgi:hypothetical protein